MDTDVNPALLLPALQDRPLYGLDTTQLKRADNADMAMSLMSPDPHAVVEARLQEIAEVQSWATRERLKWLELRGVVETFELAEVQPHA